ncbi:hypothetical protein [Fodinibius sp. AD559]|uniref:hypothetical protein n=1 Tax=Fodinibius sp. AD559 TaxID=3424179 RepID=UPI004046CA89
MNISIDKLTSQFDVINQLYHRYNNLKIVTENQSQKLRIKYSTEEGESGFLTGYIAPAEMVDY